MGGDLNLKKSWHPHLRKNQERVWKEEHSALEERKLIAKLERERQEEREMEALQKLQEAHGGKVATKRVEWMYSGPGADGQGITEDREAYLLGKRRIDNLLKANDAEVAGLKKGAAVGVDAIGGSGTVGTAQDTKVKVAHDPLLIIQKQKMEMQIKAAREAQKLEKAKERREKEKGSRRHSYHHRHHHRRDRSRSRSDDEYERRHRRRHRRDESRSRSDEEDDRRHRRHHKRDRSRSPYRDSDEEYRRERRRRRSDEARDYDRSYRHRRDDYNRDDRRGREPSPDRPERRRSDDAAERLARMQADATSVEQDRLERVREQEAKDAAEDAKYKNDREGGHKFISKMRRGVGDGIDLGDALARGRQGTRREVDV